MPRREASSLFAQTPTSAKVINREEEDFEIKPSNWNYLAAENYKHKMEEDSYEHMLAQQQSMFYHQMMESHKIHQNQQMMIRTCPVHGDGNHYKHTLDMMQAQAHAYAFSCYLYFQHMTKTAKSYEERVYY